MRQNPTLEETSRSELAIFLFSAGDVGVVRLKELSGRRERSKKRQSRQKYV
jgi:hypothetical protein